MPVYIEGRRGQTANGIKVADGRLFVTGGLYGDVRELVAAGSGAPTPLPLGPEISHVPTPDNVYGIVAVTDTRFVVVKHIDGTLCWIDVDPQAPAGRTITPIDGATVRQGQGMVLEGRRLIVADYAGVSVVELSEDMLHERVVEQLRDPSFRATAAVVHVGDRYLVVNAGGSAAPPPDTVASVPAVG